VAKNVPGFFRGVGVGKFDVAQCFGAILEPRDGKLSGNGDQSKACRANTEDVDGHGQ
jgi:hypothetical protein